jgi:hypothetical protein
MFDANVPPAGHTIARRKASQARATVTRIGNFAMDEIIGTRQKDAISLTIG